MNKQRKKLSNLIKYLASAVTQSVRNKMGNIDVE